MATRIRIKRGTESQITGYTGTQYEGELAYATNTGEVFVNNGTQFITVGGSSETPTLQSVTDAGNTTTNSIGIGTATPGYPLHIVTSNNSTVLGLDAGSAARFRFAGNSTSGYTSTFNIDDTGLDIGHDSTARSLNLKTGNQDRLTILGAGNVGIGTTAPAQVLHINKDNPYIQIQDSSAPTRGDMSAGIIMKDSTGAQSFQITQSNSVDVNIRANAGDLSLGTFVGTVIKLDGSKVGIGNTAPDEKLRVEGNIKSAGDFIGSAVKLGFAGTANITTYDTNEDLLINPNGSGNILMQTTSGNVGIGTTAPDSKVHISGTAMQQLRMETAGGPSSSGDTSGRIGDMAYDDDFFYIKTANGWGRVQLDFGF